MIKIQSIIPIVINRTHAKIFLDNVFSSCKLQ